MECHRSGKRGTERRAYLEENLAAIDIRLTPEELKCINEVAPQGVTSAPRYDESMMARVNR